MTIQDNTSTQTKDNRTTEDSELTPKKEDLVQEPNNSSTNNQNKYKFKTSEVQKINNNIVNKNDISIEKNPSEEKI